MRSSLFTTRVPDTIDTSATRQRYERQDCDSNNRIVTRVKHFDFGNDTSENIFSHPYISYMEYERLQGSQFHSKNYLLEMPGSNANAWFNARSSFLRDVKIDVESKRFKYCLF